MYVKRASYYYSHIFFFGGVDVESNKINMMFERLMTFASHSYQPLPLPTHTPLITTHIKLCLFLQKSFFDDDDVDVAVAMTMMEKY